MSKLSENITRKFTDQVDLGDEWSIETDTGWEPISQIMQTVEYERWELKLENGLTLSCADNHIVFDENMNEVFVKDLSIGQQIQTKFGLSEVTDLKNTNSSENMYDVQVDSENHRYYSNDILSHNTTAAAGYLLWYAMFVPDSTILIAAHKFSGSQEIMQRIRYGYELCPNHIRAGVTSYNKGSIEFDNGSRIVSQTTTETTGRGMAISLLYADEFAFVRPSIAREFWTSISPTLSTGGKAIITSTPNTDEDVFWNIWTEANKNFDEFGNETKLGRNGFASYFAPWDRHPERDEKWAQEEEYRVGTERFEREHNCKPITWEETLISPLKLVALEGKQPILKQGQVRWYQLPKKDKLYAVALDPCLGTGGDDAGIQVFELPSMVQVAEWNHNKTPIARQVTILSEIVKFISDETGSTTSCYYSVENNTLGEAALISIKEFGEENIPGIFISEPKRLGNVKRYRKGFNTTHKSKITACAKLKSLVENDKITINSSPLISQLKGFIASGSSYQGKPGEKDDLVMALILIIRMSMVIQNYNIELMNHLQNHDEDRHEPMPFVMIR